jgi:hypothetical protein
MASLSSPMEVFLIPVRRSPVATILTEGDVKWAASSALKVHKIEIFLASILKFVLFLY